MTDKPRIVFAGTPEFAASALDALLKSGANIVAVYTQPDRPAGRGRKLQASAVKQLALQHQLAVFQPPSLKDPEAQQQLAAQKADYFIVAAYGLLLPKAVLDIPSQACINIHASLLPRWRGAAPIQRAILAGDTQTGITIMHMDVGLDTGDMLLKKTCAISDSDTTSSLHDKLAALGGEAIVDFMQQAQSLLANAEKQDDSLANYASKISKEEGCIDWQQSAAEISRRVRAFNPWPVCYCQLDDKTLRLWDAIALDEHSNTRPGTVIQCDKHAIRVNTGNGVLQLKRLQLPGGKPVDAQAFANAHDINGKVLN